MGNAKGAGKRRGRKGKYKLVSPAKVGVQGRTHQTRFLPWIPDQVRDDEFLKHPPHPEERSVSKGDLL